MSKNYIPVAEATKGLGKKVNRCTVWRWARKGIKARNGSRVRLKHVRIGGVLHTTEADVEAFLQELAAADLEHFQAEEAAGPAAIDAPQSESRTPKHRATAIERAKAELARA